MKYTAALLVERTKQIFESEGLSEKSALFTAEAMVDADIRGHKSHGLSLLPLYIERIRSGGIDVNAVPTWIQEGQPVAILDAKGGIGQEAARLASEKCVIMAKEFGISAVAVRNNNHIGMLAAYRHPFQSQGVVGLLMNLAGSSVAPPGGAKATMGNNAVCLIVSRPNSTRPFVIDLATGIVACGKIRDAANLGISIPEGWLLNAEGLKTTNPEDLDTGGAVPVFGGHKGLAISLIVELLAGALAGQRIGMDVHRQRLYLNRVMGCSQLFLGFNPTSFGVESLALYVDMLDEAVRSSYLDNVPYPYFPEQQEVEAMDRFQIDGLEVIPTVEKILMLVK